MGDGLDFVAHLRLAYANGAAAERAFILECLEALPQQQTIEALIPWIRARIEAQASALRAAPEGGHDVR